MPDEMARMYTELGEAELQMQAARHYSETTSYQGVLQARYAKAHRFAFPPNGDQWPEDKAQRPGMIHVTQNIIAPAVMTEARIESLMPRITCTPMTMDQFERERAEAAEKLILEWLELSGFESWFFNFCQAKSTYGKSILKVFWNKRDRRPDVTVVENPANLRIGWGSSDYSTMDWTLYEYALSPFEAMRKFPKIGVVPAGRSGEPLTVHRRGDHTDPLAQLGNPVAGGELANTSSVRALSRPVAYQPSDYEGKQVRVWDYWCKVNETEPGAPEGTEPAERIVNAFFVEGVLAEKKYHDYLPDIPYIVVEHDHEPGSPEGIGDVEPLMDIQIELDRAFSHWMQLIADEIDPAWQLDADQIPAGMIPRGGEVVAAGDGKRITAIEKGIQTFPVEALITAIYRAFHFRSGLSEILFTVPPGAQTAGRALQIQIEASANRISPRRVRTYLGLREMLIFWVYMAEKVNPKKVIGVDAETKEEIKIGVGDMLKGLRRFKFVAPEITPRDSIEHTTDVVNRLNAKLISLEDAMDELGVESPLEMIKKIEAERANPKLFPGDVQSYVAVLTMLQQMQAQQAAAGGPPGVPGGDPAADATGAAQNAAQTAAPNGIQGDNGASAPMPATAVGGAQPPGAPLSNQTLIRAQPNGGAQTLQQVKVST